jgi:hypothetical protein
MLWQLAEKAVRHKLVLYPNVTVQSSENRWTKDLGCEKMTFWECMYGMPIEYPDCEGHSTVADVRTLRAAYVYNWLLFTTTFKSLFLPFPTPIVNVSVHVRMGDACEITTRDLRPKKGNMWSTGRRHCAHPQKYAFIAKKIFSRTAAAPVVHLATDDEEAVVIMNRTRFRVITSNDTANRDWYNNSEWVENRKYVDTNAVLLSVADIRFLSYGQYFLFSACGYYATVAYNIASFRHGRWLRAFSVDECHPPNLKR